ncbi:MAG TPA: hypothetical protein VFG59_05200 [Anaeromyxobacter sp.]|nr:hypothetical protein [Anaeromyxobacter sp.]
MKRPVEAAVREWVEQLSMLLERDGLPRMAGRIFGWLLVCEPPEQTMQDLAGAVQGSKASMSTSTRLLAQAGLVERVRPPGARCDAFRIRPGQWRELWRARVQMVHEVAELTGRGLALLEGRSGATRARLKMVHDQYRLIELHMPDLLARLERGLAASEPARPAGPGRRVARARHP